MRPVLFDHIAIAVPRLSDVEAILAGELGGRSTFGTTTEEFRFRHWRYEGGGDLEVLEPAGTDAFLHRFIAQRGPGIHHVTFTVPSLQAACDRARAHGYSIVGYDDSDPEWKEAFLHPRQAQGIVVQFAEPNAAQPSPPANGDGAGQGASARTRDAVAPIKVLGLRLSARSRERAETQWGAVIQGARSEAGDGGLLYRWPGSFMYVAIDIDATREEGPLWIEYSTRRAVALPESGPHPVLGAVFKRLPADQVASFPALRLWSLHPRYLDSRGLVALWREALLTQAVLRQHTKGYRRHPQLDRFRRARAPVGSIAAYLRAVRDEASRRGYAFDPGRIARAGQAPRATVTRGQLDWERRHLLAKLRRRDPSRAVAFAAVRHPRAHPLFRVVPGGIEAWERIR